MLTPFQIEKEVQAIKWWLKNKQEATLTATEVRPLARTYNREILALYRRVLLEISEGSIDPKSLALAAVEVVPFIEPPGP